MMDDGCIPLWMDAHRWVHLGNFELNLQPWDPSLSYSNALPACPRPFSIASLSHTPASLPVPLPGAPIELPVVC